MSVVILVRILEIYANIAKTVNKAKIRNTAHMSVELQAFSAANKLLFFFFNNSYFAFYFAFFAVVGYD